MDYKFDKSVEKKRLRTFWTLHWQYNTIDNLFYKITEGRYRNIIKVVIKDACIKLTLEKKITEQELYNLLNMLDSPDDENKYIVLCIIKKYKKTKFIK